MQAGETLLTVSVQQPVELGHRRRQRTAIAQAAYSQTRWSILQAELGAWSRPTAPSDGRLPPRQARGRPADRPVPGAVAGRAPPAAGGRPGAGADVVLAEVENVAIQQDQEATRQEYVAALAALRRKIGVADGCVSLEPAGPLQTPGLAAADNGEELVHMALESRPEVRSAWAQVCAAEAAVRLAQADRIPIPAVGPFYEHDESGTTFYGLGITSEVPILNFGPGAGGPARGRMPAGPRGLPADAAAGARRGCGRPGPLERAAQLGRPRRAWAETTAVQAGRMRDLYDAGQSTWSSCWASAAG